jgi:hypothetical protein
VLVWAPWPLTVLSFDRAISAECGTGKNDEDAKFQRRSYKERSTARHLTAILGTKPGMRHRRSQRLSLVGLLTHYMGRQVTRAACFTTVSSHLKTNPVMVPST